MLKGGGVSKFEIPYKVPASLIDRKNMFVETWQGMKKYNFPNKSDNNYMYMIFQNLKIIGMVFPRTASFRAPRAMSWAI